MRVGEGVALHVRIIGWCMGHLWRGLGVCEEGRRLRRAMVVNGRNRIGGGGAYRLAVCVRSVCCSGGYQVGHGEHDARHCVWRIDVCGVERW